MYITFKKISPHQLGTNVGMFVTTVYTDVFSTFPSEQTECKELESRVYMNELLADMQDIWL